MVSGVVTGEGGGALSLGAALKSGCGMGGDGAGILCADGSALGPGCDGGNGGGPLWGSPAVGLGSGGGLL